MPTFGFKCNDCDAIVEIDCKWSKDMDKDLDNCECGSHNFRRYMTVTPKTYGTDNDPESRLAESMMNPKWH